MVYYMRQNVPSTPFKSTNKFSALEPMHTEF